MQGTMMESLKVSSVSRQKCKSDIATKRHEKNGQNGQYGQNGQGDFNDELSRYAE